MLTRKQRNWALDNFGSPAAPLLWFARILPLAGPGRWLLGLAQWVVLVVWAVGLIWVWFPVFAVLFLWEGFSSHSAPKESKPPEPSGH